MVHPKIEIEGEIRPLLQHLEAGWEMEHVILFDPKTAARVVLWVQQGQVRAVPDTRYVYCAEAYRVSGALGIEGPQGRAVLREQLQEAWLQDEPFPEGS